MSGFGGDYRKNEKKKLSKDRLEKMAQKNVGETSSVFKLPEVISKKRGNDKGEEKQKSKVK